MIWDIINMYRAIPRYYSLRCPYPFMILFLVTIWYIPKAILLWLVPDGIIFLIRVAQSGLFWVTKIFPFMHDSCSKVDSVLNIFGLWLENSEKTDNRANKNNILKRRRRLPVWKIYGLLLFGTCIFLIAPYYLESNLTENSQQVCAGINQFIDEKVANVRTFVDRYYVPRVHDEEVEQAESEKLETGTEERIVLHLGAKGMSGSNLRSSPEKVSDNIVGVVRGDVELYFEDEIQETEGIIWVLVSTDEVSRAWISRNLLDEEEIDMFLQ